MSIVYVEPSRKFILTTDHTAYCLGIDPSDGVQHLYWGRALPRLEDYPDCHPIGETIGIGPNLENPPGLSLSSYFYPYEGGRSVANDEYLGWEALTFAEPCLKVIFPDGVRDLALRYNTHQIDGEDLVVSLKDSYYPLWVRLHYRVLADVDLIVRWAEVENQCQGSVRLESVQSAVWYVPTHRAYRLTHLTGRWGDEFNLQQTMLQQGKRVMESRSGLTSHHESPWFALDPEGTSTEQSGQVWFGTLAWSGNWKIAVETTAINQTRITTGINDFDFAWELKPGERFTAPECIGGYSEDGFGGASRQLHRYGLRYVYPENQRGHVWPVFYNTWEAFGFNFDETQVLALAEKAAALGVEVFHLDDGWFGTRQNEFSGLGDWVVNTQRFPNGLGPLVQKIESLGMKFSLWIEPENVNEDSDLYRSHPDWVYRFPTRPPTLQRESLVLNLGREDVRAYLWERISSLILEYGVMHFKWDMNRHISEPGWPALPADQQKEIWVRHVQGVYELKRRIKQDFPQVTLECCAGGGGRVDYGILKFCETALVSDNHDPLSRLLIQEGYSQVFPAKTMGSWVTDPPSPLTGRSLPMTFTFHAAMLGTMGLMSNILEWDDQETEYARQMIQLYKEIRPIIQEGDQYRLISLRTDHLGAVQYVDPDGARSVIFAFMRTHPGKQTPMPNLLRWAHPRFPFRVYPRGLRPDALYQVGEDSRTLSGEALMTAGIQIEMAGDYDSQYLLITQYTPST